MINICKHHVMHHTRHRHTLCRHTLGVILSFSLPSLLPAQGINMADAMKPAFEAMARQFQDAVRRRLVMDPQDKQLTVSDSMVTITVTNNHEDSARTLIKVHKSPPPAAIAPPRPADSTKSKPKRSLVAKEENSDSGAVYKDLSPWVTTKEQEFVLGPGETKSITVSVRVPSDIPEGEYAAWVGAHVVVGKSTKPAKSTISETYESGGRSHKVDVMGVPTSLPEGMQIISSTKLVVKK